ncbi:MAG: signal peptide peptidase SppA [SAR324 cluster bacterium]|nr:signal peptide peptidase SppA [SAR324 cluster bacterium]
MNILKRHPYFSSIVILAGLLLILTGLLNVTQKQNLTFLKEGVIGVIEIKGVILNPDPVVAQIQKMARTESILGVIVRLDSPGGGVAASQEIFDALNHLKSKKPIYSSMGAVAASGAYYIACATNRIFANPGTITGSIGVLLQWFNLEELTEKIGAKSMTIKSAQNKDLMSMFRELRDPERDILQQLVDDSHEQFVQAIMQGREKLTEEKVRELADGRIMAGNRAKTFGLIDEVASYPQVLQALANHLGLSDPVRTIQFDQKNSWFNLLTGLLPFKQFLPPPSGIRLSYLLE